MTKNCTGSPQGRERAEEREKGGRDRDIGRDREREGGHIYYASAYKYIIILPLKLICHTEVCVLMLLHF